MADSTGRVSGSDAPELKEVRVGFIPLTDCASLVVALLMKFDEKYGIKITLSKEASWAAIRMGRPATIPLVFKDS